MEVIKAVMTVIATVLPLSVCVLLAWRLSKGRATEWKLATCLSGLAVATSLVLLLASERVAFLRYGEAVLQVNQKAEETRNLTELNKRIVKLTAQAFVASQKGPIMADGYNSADLCKPLEEMLRAAGATSSEIDQILERTNSTPAKP